MLVSDRYTSQEPVRLDWSAPAMGAPTKANQPGKPLFRMGITVGQLFYIIFIMFPWYFSTVVRIFISFFLCYCF
jgi:phage terminase large subunit-like protein